MRILITGASGYVGSKLLDDLSTRHSVVGTYKETKLKSGLQRLDVTDRKSVIEFVTTAAPDIVIHTAALASRSACTQDPEYAACVNAVGTDNVVEGANLCGAGVLYLSSMAASSPSTDYGRTKLLGETSVKKASTEFAILRLSFTFGRSPNITNDRPFNRILAALRTGVVDVFDNSEIFHPTALQHVSTLVQSMVQSRLGNTIFNVAVPELKTMYEVAVDILNPFGKASLARAERSGGSDQGPKPSDLELTTNGWTYQRMVDEIVSNIFSPGITSPGSINS